MPVSLDVVLTLEFMVLLLILIAGTSLYSYRIYATSKSQRSELEIQLEDCENRLRSALAEVDRLDSALIQESSSRSRGILSDLKILGIWPDQSLNIHAERKALYDEGFEYVGLYGAEATRSNIVDRLAVHGINVIEIGAHGNESGVVLWGDDKVGPGWWSRVVREYPVTMVVFMACSSISIGRVVSNANVPYVIAILRQIDDTSASQFVAQFYRQLAAGKSVENSLDVAKLVMPHYDAEGIVLLREGKAV